METGTGTNTETGTGIENGKILLRELATIAHIRSNHMPHKEASLMRNTIMKSEPNENLILEIISHFQIQLHETDWDCSLRE